mmetsp:Transcript_18109/g.55447  ORF Transcript_18109/g.55447 Transcript_18109/m.55447 type:complete len:161 (-) Transcript_18109:807-1289(-)
MLKSGASKTPSPNAPACSLPTIPSLLSSQPRVHTSESPRHLLFSVTMIIITLARCFCFSLLLCLFRRPSSLLLSSIIITAVSSPTKIRGTSGVRVNAESASSLPLVVVVVVVVVGDVDAYFRDFRGEVVEHGRPAVRGRLWQLALLGLFEMRRAARDLRC